MKEIYKKGKVKTICYGKEKTWNEREEAIAFFTEGIYNSEGAEQQRHIKILTDLKSGKSICSDE